jgi:hypothetical protein
LYERRKQMESTVRKTWKPTTAGILNIVAGVSSLLGLIAIIIAIVAAASGPYLWEYFPGYGPAELGIALTVLIIIAVVLAVIGLLPLIGGIYALQRKKWGLALAGSIAAVVGTFILGVLAIVFLALSKDEFE